VSDAPTARRTLSEFLGSALLAVIVIASGSAPEHLGAQVIGGALGLLLVSVLYPQRHVANLAGLQVAGAQRYIEERGEAMTEKSDITEHVRERFQLRHQPLRR